MGRNQEILEPYGAVILIDTDRYGEFVDAADEIFQEIGLTDFDEDGEFFDRWADAQGGTDRFIPPSSSETRAVPLPLSAISLQG